MRQVWLSDRFRTLWQGRDPFDEVNRLEGEVFRQMTTRKTIRVALDEAHYFAKIHYGIGWRTIFKDLLYLRLPVLGAQNEWRALKLLHELDVPTMTPVAFGRTGSNPARMQSFLITEELTGTTSLEDLCATWAAQPPPFRLRQALSERLAACVRLMHSHGVNHRDCYICHFLLDTSSLAGSDTNGRGSSALDTLRLFVIDLHRAQIRRRTPTRWLVKDLAGLYFSTMGVPITRTDRLRFIRVYEQKPLRDVFQQRAGFWRRVERTAVALHRKLQCSCS